MIETRWSVLTGAPCAGKTTVLHALEKRGFKCIPEVARVHIDSELSKGRSIEEIRSDEGGFQHKLMEAKADIESRLSPTDLVFLDRAMPDSLSYLRIAGLDTREVMKLCLQFRYHRVFLFDRLPMEYDGRRVENDQLQEVLERELEADYRQFGYDVVRVPVMKIEERVKLILDCVVI